MLKKVNKIEHYINKAIKSTLETALSKSYSIKNPGLRHTLERPVASLNALHRLTAEKRESRVCIARGTARGSGQPMTVAFIGLWEYGQTNILPFYQHLFFEDDHSELEDLGPCPEAFPRRQAELLAGQADLVAVLAHQQRAWQPRGGEWILFPSVVRMVFHYNEGEEWAAVEQRLKKKQRHNLITLQRANYTCQVSESDEDFDFFYERMYQPMVQNRYKDYGALVAKSGLYQLFKNRGILMLIKDAQGEVISGALNYVRHNVLYALVNGVRDGDVGLIRKSALTAVHYFVIQHGHQMGVRCFDVGVGVPLLNDGVYQHKRQWGYEPEWNNWETDMILLWAPRSAPAAVEWLRANPVLPGFVKWGGEAMQAAYSAAPA